MPVEHDALCPVFCVTDTGVRDFLGMFASAAGKRDGQFYTPRSIVETLVAVLAPHHGKVHDPCCGSGGMFVLSEEFILSTSWAPKAVADDDEGFEVKMQALTEKLGE